MWTKTGFVKIWITSTYSVSEYEFGNISYVLTQYISCKVLFDTASQWEPFFDILKRRKKVSFDCLQNEKSMIFTTELEQSGFTIRRACFLISILSHISLKFESTAFTFCGEQGFFWFYNKIRPGFFFLESFPAVHHSFLEIKRVFIKIQNDYWRKQSLDSRTLMGYSKLYIIKAVPIVFCSLKYKLKYSFTFHMVLVFTII